MITRDLRCAIVRAVAAAGFELVPDPGLRPAGAPGRYAASVALALGPNPREAAGTLAATLTREHWIETTEVTGPGYLTVTVTTEALAAVADNIITAGPACITSDALAGVTVPAAPPGDPLAAATWEEARAALAARLTARLAAAAGATVAASQAAERVRVSRPPSTDTGTGEATSRSEDPTDAGLPGPPPGRNEVPVPGAGGHGAEPFLARGATVPLGPVRGATAPAADKRGGPQRQAEGCEGVAPQEAAAFAGRDAVLFTLARAIPGKPLRVEPEIIARRVPGNPAYAVRYAHARAAAGLRWATASLAAGTIGAGKAPQSLLADPGSEFFVLADGAGTIAVCAIGLDREDIGGSPRREETALLDALSWLPERVATAARRGRPDEFARYLEDLAHVTVDVLSSANHQGTSHPGEGAAPGSDKLTLAMAARTALAAGLALLEVSAPDRL